MMQWVHMKNTAFAGEIRDADTFSLIAIMPEGDDRPDDFDLIAKAPDFLDVCRKLVEYRDRVGALGFQLEKADDFIREMRNIISELDNISKS